MNITSTTYWDIPEGNVDKVVDPNGNTIFEDTTDYTMKWFHIRRWIGTDNLKVKITTTLSTSLTFKFWFEFGSYGSPAGTVTVDSSEPKYIDMSGHECVFLSGETDLGTGVNNTTNIRCVYADNITVEAPFSINGCLRSLVGRDPGTTVSSTGNYLFAKLFAYSSVVSAKHLVIPSNTGNSMFYQMFNGCTSLKVAPIITASTSSDYCCFRMFYNCSNLNYVESHFADISATGALSNWLYGTSSTGTFKKISTTTYPSGSSGIPSGWTIENV